MSLLLALAIPAQAARVKDIAQVDGVRDNQLIGFGLVGGLTGTGDDPKSAPYTAEAIANMLGSQGFVVDPAVLKVKNFAAVMVTANLPAYASSGGRIDVTVSAAGTAKSLANGVLYQTLLKGADGKVYAVAQGSLSFGTAAGGESGRGRGQQALTVARIPDGALVENEVPSTILKDGALRLNLAHPDFTTASMLAAAVNKSVGHEAAHADDAGTVSVAVPDSQQDDLVPFIAALENLDITPSSRAKLVINPRTGTVVFGADVSIMPVSVTHGSMTLTFGEQLAPPNGSSDISQTPALSLPSGAPLSSGLPEASPLDPGDEQAAEPLTTAMPVTSDWMLQPTTAQQVAVGLNRLKLSAPDIVSIFEAIDAAGALLGDLEIL